MLNRHQLLNKIYSKIKQIKSEDNLRKKNHISAPLAYFYDLNNSSTGKRDYQKFADEAYSKNVIAYRSINIISQGAASVPWNLHKITRSGLHEVKHHPILNLLHQPNPSLAGAEFFENIYAYRLISGNAYILAISDDQQHPKELHVLRPDRVTVASGKNGLPAGYYYELSSDQKKFYPLNNITGQSNVLHIKNFNPLNDWYGLSPIEAAAYSIDQHNQAAIWNQSLLNNGGRPSGALIFKPQNDYHAAITEEQFLRVKHQLEEVFSGPNNSGRPMILEGGVEWREMSMTPRDMDFTEAKQAASRDIALAFGVPPQLLGIPGDNKYSNMQEARLALWEETILPLLDHLMDSLNHWLVPMYGNDLKLSYNKDEISALASRRENIWSRIEKASFLTINEKRAMIGLTPIKNGDILPEISDSAM